MHFLGISGSLRKQSFNTSALQACQQLLPQGVTMSLFDIAPIPLYNDDVYQQGFPDCVKQLREQIRAADALVIATPEYNYSFPGVLKNAIDWASRPPSQPFDGKLVGLLGAAAGGMGSSRAQYQLRQVFVALNAQLLNRPEVFISGAAAKYDAEGRLADAAAREHIGKLLAALADRVRTLQG